MTPHSSRWWERSSWVAAAAGVAASLTACSVDAPRGEGEHREAAGQAVIEAGGWQSQVLPWGHGAGQVGLREAAPESPAEGPSAVAIGAGGEVLVLDRWNQRVLAIAPSGEVHMAGAVARDAEHLAAAADGTIAAWSPLRATVQVIGRDGAALGEVAVPRVLRDIQRIGIGGSHRVQAMTSMQETWELGSPRAPLDLADTLRSRREGAAFLADGRGVAARRSESGAGEILVFRAVDPADDAKPPISWQFAIAAPVAAVRVAGTWGNTLCVRVERVTQGAALEVEREALCVEAGSGAIRLKQALGRPGLYAPHEELAVGGGALAWIRPEAGGLRVTRRSLATQGTEVAQ